jgi:H/ACA ribonucleoprotein complex subunit 4
MAAVKKHVDADGDSDMIIKPDATAPKVDTSEWPLLLKNWDQRKSC